MARITNFKSLMQFLALIFCLSFILLFYGCGTAGDETTTTGGRQVSLAGLPITLAVGQSSILTATVTDGSGKVVSGQTVSFTFVSNTSGATLATLNSGTTDISGKALAVYTAGATSPTISVQDTIQASVAGATGVVIITRTAGTSTDAGADYISSFSASLSTVTGGQMSVITATVRHEGKSGETSDQTITFTIPVNNSGASFIDSSGAIVSTITVPLKLAWLTNTDVSVTYKAGTNVSGTVVEDMIQAVLGNGATSSVLVTRTASTTGTYAVSISPSSPSVTAGQVSIITATVTSGSAPIGGVSVTFTLPVNSSGATLSAATATTDGSGKAVVIYQPGSTNPTQSLQDTVQAAVGTATDAKAITRTGSSTSAFSITVGALPATLTSDAASSVVVANVKNNLGTVVSGVTVNFAVTGVLPLGTLSVALATTDGSGNAVTTFTGNGAGATGATSVVTASITVSGNTYTNAVIIIYP